MTISNLFQRQFTFIVLKCNIEITNQDEYNERCCSIHGIIPAHLKRQHSIKVDSKIVFKLDPALNIEHVGPDEQNNILNGWYNRSLGRGVFTSNSNKANADLNEDRSTEFLKEVEASTSKTFFPKFKIKLRAIVGVDLEYAFTAKWSQIEKAFYNFGWYRASCKTPFNIS